MTVYEALIALGYSEQEIREAANIHAGTRTISLALKETPDEFPIVGLSYVCDYRYEEEEGIYKLAAVLNDTPEQWKHFASTANGFVYFATSPLPDEHFKHQIVMAQEYHTRMLPYVQESDAQRLAHSTVAEMKAFAAERSISLTGLTKKVDIFQAIIAASPNQYPSVWPAWFHFGNFLGFKAEGIVGDTLNLLLKAAQRNTLGVSNSSMVFASGLGLYDTRDIGPKLTQQRAEERAVYEAAMKALEPVAAELTARGYRWYALGRPTVIRPKDAETMETRYWLNGHYVNGLGQPYGWYSLDELLAEKFITDMKRK